MMILLCHSNKIWSEAYMPSEICATDSLSSTTTVCMYKRDASHLILFMGRDNNILLDFFSAEVTLFCREQPIVYIFSYVFLIKRAIDHPKSISHVRILHEVDMFIGSHVIQNQLCVVIQQTKYHKHPHPGIQHEHKE